MITFLHGDDLNVPKIKECILVEWTENHKRVVFSFAKLGKGITVHFACKQESLRELKTAINDFCEWAFWAFAWCECVFAISGKKSINRIAQKCGFNYLAVLENYQVYMRPKP